MRASLFSKSRACTIALDTGSTSRRVALCTRISVWRFERVDEGLFVLEVQSLHHSLGHWIHLKKSCFFKGRLVGNVVITSFTFFLLEFDGNSSDWSSSDAFHEMGDETGDLVSESLGGDDCDFFDDPFVRVEIESEHHIILLDDSAGDLLNGLSSNAAHGD